jgi:predicted membrane channel-forming protein YqfA (hemolysin III family)
LAATRPMKEGVESFGLICSMLFQAMIITEIVAMVVVRRRLAPTTANALGKSWHQRLETLTYMVRPVLIQGGLVCLAVLAIAAAMSALGADPGRAAILIGGVALSIALGVYTWRIARSEDWERVARSWTH